MKILLMGPQGSGKGTIGEMLSNHLHLPLIAVGDVLRSIPQDHPWYEEFHTVMNKGELAPQGKVAQLLKERTSQPDCKNGFIQDGWGRKMIDLEYFDPGYDLVLFLKISPETTVYRLSNRRTCRNCNKVYNIITAPPKVENVCDVCGGELYQRKDDTEEAIRRRLAIFNSDTQEVLDHFRKQGKLIEIDGEPMPDEVFESVKKAVENISDQIEVNSRLEE